MTTESPNRSPDSLVKISEKYLSSHFLLFRTQLETALPFDLLSSVLACSPQDLVALCQRNRTVALHVLQTPKLNAKLGGFNPEALDAFTDGGSSYTSPTVNGTQLMLFSGQLLFAVCNAHAETRAYARSNEALLKRLSKEQQKDLLQENRENALRFAF